MRPGMGQSEVCEGESFVLQCPPATVIKLGHNSLVQFGRGGDREAATRCGPGQQVNNCTTVNAKRLLLAGRCAGRERCALELAGRLPGPDPCPTARKFLTLSFSCKRPLLAARPTTTPASVNRSDITQMENKLMDELEAFTEIDGNTTNLIANFFEEAFDNIADKKGQYSPSETSIMNITERISNKIMDLLNRQDKISELEIKTSQLTLKLVRKEFHELEEHSKTVWTSDDKEISLPDQAELVVGAAEDTLEIMMAVYNNLSLESSASEVITVSVSRPVSLSQPLTFLLPNHGDTAVSCAFWSFPHHVWSADGCQTVCHNSSHTKCACNHLTNFALIFNVHGESAAARGPHARQLQFITYVGFTISILCMVMTVIVFLFQRRQSSTERDVIHVNLCLSLLTAELIFMFGIDQTSDTATCAVIAASLHYFFLSSFAWMFLEGYQIYKMLVRVFESPNSPLKTYFAFGYLTPLSIVLISFVVDWLVLQGEADTADMCYSILAASSYGQQDYCWLATHNKFILTFIIPAVLVILSNVAMLGFALHSMMVGLTGNCITVFFILSDLLTVFYRGIFARQVVQTKKKIV